MRDYAEIAYEAYRAHTGGVSLISGALIPVFGALKPEIQEAWEAAARAVIQARLKDN
jgi:hypothetical protein